MYSDPRINVFSRIQWYHWLEMILPIFLVLNPIILFITKNELMGMDFYNWAAWYIIAITFVLILGIITYKKLGFNDFRFKLYIHLVVIGLSTTIAGLMLSKSGFLDYLGTKLPSELVFDVFMVILVPLMIILVGAIMAIYALTDPFMEELGKISSEVTTGNISAQMDNKELLNDSVFGPACEFINGMISYSRSLIDEIAITTSVISSSSENLSAGAQEVNASAEEVASTSQAMSDGATTQTELISEVNQKIEQLREIMDDIVKKIHLNTQEVAQIALQTNILALNAGIEASRAGDYGRGFAVVAENVRKLSDQSKLASERIENVAMEITNILGSSFNDISNTMINVVSVSEETAASAEEVAAAAEEMTSTMEEVSSMSNELSAQAQKSSELISKINID